MTLLVIDDGDVDREITAVEVTDVGNVNRVISEIRVLDTNLVDHIVYSTAPDLSASASPTDVFGYDSGTGTAVTNTTTVTPTGGTAPYTYAWTLISYNSGTPPTIGGPTSDITPFIQSAMAPSDYFVAVFRCTVTDDDLNTATTDVNASFYSLGP